jgi:NAD(P)-dependent dehydrogenase (short-subunit alcohol dehydrogenase family)
MKPIWFKNHVAYTMAKYGMSMCVLGMAEEFKADRIAVNAVWPKTGTLSPSSLLYTLIQITNNITKNEGNIKII